MERKQILFKCIECNENKNYYQQETLETLNEAMAHILETGHKIEAWIELPAYSISSGE